MGLDGDGNFLVVTEEVDHQSAGNDQTAENGEGLTADKANDRLIIINRTVQAGGCVLYGQSDIS